MTKYYKIADLIVEMDTFGRTEAQAEKYILPQNPEKIDIVIVPDRDRIQSRFPDMTLADAEYMATGSSFHRQILNFDGTMLHSSAVVMDGKAYMFSASCGTGKSTHTQLWRTVFGDDRAVILNDDKPVIRLIDGKWYAYGTPWSGKTEQNINMRVPIAGICLLSRGKDNKISKCNGTESIQPLLMQIPKPNEIESRIKVLELLDKLITDVPVWKLQCNMEPEAAIVSYEAMSGHQWREK